MAVNETEVTLGLSERLYSWYKNTIGSTLRNIAETGDEDHNSGIRKCHQQPGPGLDRQRQADHCGLHPSVRSLHAGIHGEQHGDALQYQGYGRGGHGIPHS